MFTNEFDHASIGLNAGSGDNTMGNDRVKALDAALGQIDRQFGKGAVIRLGDSEGTDGVRALSAGSRA